MEFSGRGSNINEHHIESPSVVVVEEVTTIVEEVEEYKFDIAEIIREVVEESIVIEEA
jgi:hypothetical protein